MSHIVCLPLSELQGNLEQPVSGADGLCMYLYMSYTVRSVGGVDREVGRATEGE